MNDQIMPRDFLGHCYDVCDPPFCFRCGDRRAWCRCKEGPMSKSEHVKHWVEFDKAKEGDVMEEATQRSDK